MLLSKRYLYIFSEIFKTNCIFLVMYSVMESLETSASDTGSFVGFLCIYFPFSVRGSHHGEHTRKKKQFCLP